MQKGKFQCMENGSILASTDGHLFIEGKKYETAIGARVRVLCSIDDKILVAGVNGKINILGYEQ